MIGLKNYFKTSIKKGGAPGRVLRVSSITFMFDPIFQEMILTMTTGGRGRCVGTVCCWTGGAGATPPSQRNMSSRT